MCMLLILGSNACSWLFIIISHAKYVNNSFTRYRFAVSYMYVNYSWVQFMRPNIHSYSATPFISKSFTRSRFAVSYVCAIDSKFRIMQLIIQSYFAYIYIQIVHVISVRRVLGVCYWLYVWMHADEYSVVFCTPYIRESFTRSRFAMPYVYAIDSRFQIMQLNIHSYFACHT